MRPIVLEPLLWLGMILGSRDAKVSKSDKVPFLTECSLLERKYRISK